MASIFSKIVAGDIPSYKVAEDENYYAFLDINPVAKGHTLVIPKHEVNYIFDLQDNKTFRCKILRIIPEDTKTPSVIRSKGDFPILYEAEADDESDFSAVGPAQDLVKAYLSLKDDPEVLKDAAAVEKAAAEIREIAAGKKVTCKQYLAKVLEWIHTTTADEWLRIGISSAIHISANWKDINSSDSEARQLFVTIESDVLEEIVRSMNKHMGSTSVTDLILEEMLAGISGDSAGSSGTAQTYTLLNSVADHIIEKLYIIAMAYPEEKGFDAFFTAIEMLCDVTRGETPIFNNWIAKVKEIWAERPTDASMPGRYARIIARKMRWFADMVKDKDDLAELRSIYDAADEKEEFAEFLAAGLYFAFERLNVDIGKNKGKWKAMRRELTGLYEKYPNSEAVGVWFYMMMVWCVRNPKLVSEKTRAEYEKKIREMGEMYGDGGAEKRF